MVTMTDECRAYLETQAAREGAPLVGVRVKVKGGGCSGLSYDVALASDATERDLVFGEAPQIIVDPKSHTFIDGLVLDVSRGLVGTGFVFNNPNAKKTCGCGTSFSIG